MLFGYISQEKSNNPNILLTFMSTFMLRQNNREVRLSKDIDVPEVNAIMYTQSEVARSKNSQKVKKKSYSNLTFCHKKQDN